MENIEIQEVKLKFSRNFIDLTGLKFNKLTVIKIIGKTKSGGALYECLCDCGNITSVASSHLKNGHTKSCGCFRLQRIYETQKSKNFIGKRFGRLLVIEEIDKRYRSFIIWKCLCDCGNIIHTSTGPLQSGQIKSCGCIIRDTRLAFGESSFHLLCYHYKRNAKNRNLDFLLSEEEFRNFTLKNCFYCSAIPASKMQSNRGYGFYIYNGIDRIDNSKGYTVDNCVTCCSQCNRAKMDFSLNEFNDWSDRLYLHRNSQIQMDYQI